MSESVETAVNRFPASRVDPVRLRVEVRHARVSVASSPAARLATHHGNVRQLAATIDEAVNIRLVDLLLNASEPPADAPDSSDDHGEQLGQGQTMPA